MKKFVRITSNKTIRVTGGLYSENLTNKDSRLENRLNVKPAWTNLIVLIKAGTGLYPSEIKDWPTVKALEKDEVLTIGNETDEGGDEKEKEVLVKEIKRAKEKCSVKVSDVNLSSLAEDNGEEQDD